MLRKLVAVLALIVFIVPFVLVHEASMTFAASADRKSKVAVTQYPTDDVVVADYDVTDFGADRSGKRDSTASIQQAIDNAYKSGGGTVWMPAGTYRVTGRIQIRAFVTLRGDWRDPDGGGSGDYGTVISADVPPGLNGPALFRIGGSAGVKGLTVFYPNQNASNPVPYNFTFEIPGRAWGGEENYMTSSIINVTMINSYMGIGIGMMPNDHGGTDRAHESSTVKNVKGTVLHRGVIAYNGADAGTWEHVRLFNSYWANAGKKYNAPSLDKLNSWTRANGVAYTFGDLEWDQFYAIEASDYNVGIHLVKGQRIEFSGQFLWANILNTNTAVKVDGIDTRWGTSFLRSVLNGSHQSIQNNTAGYVQVTDSNISGGYSGNVKINADGKSPVSYMEPKVPKVSKAVLYDVTKPPYNAPRVSPRGQSMPQNDATKAVQSALDDAGRAGGGIVYLPAGWYRINTRLNVPANVELRGSSSVPQRDQTGLSAGTVLMAYEGHNTSKPSSAAALITLAGDRSGVSGLRILYPQNNPAKQIVPYPYAIRGKGSETYVVNVGFTNAYNGIDMKTHRNDNHYISKLTGTIFHYGIVVGPSKRGWINGVLTNGTGVVRVGYGIPGWASESRIFPQVIDRYTRKTQQLVRIDGASDEKLMNVFAYGPKVGLHVSSGNVQMFNLGTDNLGADGYSVRVVGGSVKVMNVMRYNGKTSTGKVAIFNPMNL